jgi:hypothetical protein
LHPIARIPTDLAAKPACPLVEALRRIEPATAPQLAIRLGLKPKHVSASLRQREGVGSVVRCGFAPASGNRDAVLWRAA